MDHEELENLKFPVTVMIIETLDGDATDADLYNAGYNMFEMEIHSLYDEDADGGEEE
jgi:hypothetical protein